MNKKEKTKLFNFYNNLKAKQNALGDYSENYTTGYLIGHLNGQIELLENILNIDTGLRTTDIRR